MLYITDKKFSLEMISPKALPVSMGVELLDEDEVKDAIAETSAGLNCLAAFSDPVISIAAERALHIDAPVHHHRDINIVLNKCDEVIIVDNKSDVLTFTHVFIDSTVELSTVTHSSDYHTV